MSSQVYPHTFRPLRDGKRCAKCGFDADHPIHDVTERPTAASAAHFISSATDKRAKPQ